MAISKERFRQALDEFYSKEVLFELFEKYFLDWIGEGYIGSNLGLFGAAAITENTNKQTFLDLLDQAFLKEEIFTTIFGTLPKDVQEVFNKVAWDGRFPVENKEPYFIKAEGYNLYRGLKPEFLFFKCGETEKKETYLYLHNDIVKMLRKFLPKPRQYYILKVNKPEYSYKKSSEEEIIDKLPIYFNFYSKGNLSLSSSNKILKESKRNMQKYCGIDEFYRDSKDLDYLKTETISLLFFLIKDEHLKLETFRIDNYKSFINDLLNGDLIKSHGCHYTSLYLNYLKGIKNIWKKSENIKRSLESIKRLLRTFKEGEVVDVDNIIKYLIYRDEFVEIVEPQDVYDYIYINEANYGRTRINDHEAYQEYIIDPFIKSLLFILGSLGVLEVYYDIPNSTRGLYLKNGYLSKYDGLKYISLTKLGAYALDLIDSYDFGEVKEEAEIYLDENRLILSIIGEAPIKSMILEKMAEKMGENKFKFTTASFLKDIENKEELDSRIKELKKIIDADLPKMWNDFIENILSKSNMIESAQDIVVLKIKHDRELIEIIARDKELKSLILRAEGFYILVKREDLEIVKGRLSSYGYLATI